MEQLKPRHPSRAVHYLTRMNPPCAGTNDSTTSSKYDAWQIGSELQIHNWVGNKTLQDSILQYGKDFLTQFAPVQQESKNGAMITSCISHGCNWNGLTTGNEGDNRTAINHYADWYHGKTTGSAAIHVDARGPNGDGAITDSHCSKFS